MERHTKKIDLGGISSKGAFKIVDSYRAPLSHASIPPKVHVVEPLPNPIEPVGWWESCWLNPKRKKDVYDLPSIRQYDTIG